MEQLPRASERIRVATALPAPCGGVSTPPRASEGEALLLRLKSLVTEGLRNGNFKLEATGTVGSANKRQVVFSMAKTERYVIPEAELP